MSNDFRVSSSFFSHTKYRMLRRRLGDHGVVSLLRLWAYAATNHPNGHIRGTEEYVELSAEFDGDEGALVTALAECGFIEQADGGYRLHDWAHHQPWVSGSSERSIRAKLTRRVAVDGDKATAARHIAAMHPEHASLCYSWAGIEEESTCLTSRQRDVDAALTPYPTPTPIPIPTPSPSPSPAHSDSDSDSEEDFFLDGTLGMVPRSWGKAGNGALSVLRSVRPSRALWKAVVSEVSAKPRRRPWGYAAKILPQRAEAARATGPQSATDAIGPAPESQYKGLGHWARLGAAHGVPAPTAAEHERLLSLDGQGAHAEAGIVSQFALGAATWTSAMHRWEAAERKAVDDALDELRLSGKISADFSLPELAVEAHAD